MNENNGLSSSPASYASETQNHIDNTGDPSSDGEAGPGSTLGVHAAHSPVPSCITGAQDVDEEDPEISMLQNNVDDLNIFGLDDTTRVEGECETGNPTSLVEAAEERDYRAEVTASTTAQARDRQLTTASVRKLLQRLEISHIPRATLVLPATRL